MIFFIVYSFVGYVKMNDLELKCVFVLDLPSIACVYACMFTRRGPMVIPYASI